jgi:2-amino-1-hydroxyethylphosphonate dioxygenase (glycine-forming)
MTTLKQINELFTLYQKYGCSDYIGEDVSQVEHMTQAAMLAEHDNQPIEVVLAALFHDIGHLIEQDNRDYLGAINHEDIAYNYLKKIGIPEPIPTLVKGHVVAKRYLVTTDKKYYNRLSESSKQTLIQQGGLLTEQECRVFNMHPLSYYMLKIRHYDDKAKVKHKSLVHLNYYKFLLIRFMDKRYN